VALKVLLADDSVPAQNMGKKILTEAGYEVLAVGNGLEALRKIADSVPDIAILDIFMPGYTGLEICARLRGNAVTADLPVILTVGKLEPYRPEDGEQVRSNGVIVKPFASGELISAVRSLVGLPFAIRRPMPEVEAPPAPAKETAPIEEFAEEEPMSMGLGFDPDAKRTAFSASAIEEPPALLTAEVANPLVAEEAALAPYASRETSALTDFDLLTDFDPKVAPPNADSAAVSPALVEWWQLAGEELDEMPEYHDNMESSLGLALAEEAHAEYSTDAPDGIGAEPIQQSAAIESAAMPPHALPAAAARELENVTENFARDVAEDIAQLAAEPATLAPAASDRESCTEIFEPLITPDEPSPLEGPEGVTDVLADVADDVVSQAVLQAHSEMPVALEASPDDTRFSATGSSAITENLEPASAGDALSVDASQPGELRLEGAALADWLSSGKVPHSVAAPLEHTAAQAAPAAGSFYAAIPEAAPERLQAAAVEGSEPMVCYLPKEHAATEAAPESSNYPVLDTAAQVAYIEVQRPQIDAPQSEVSGLETSGSEAEIAPVELACDALELPNPQVNLQPPTESAQLPAEMASAEPCEGTFEGTFEDERDSVLAATNPGGEAKRIHHAVESVFDRFRPLLIAAIARELTKHS